MSFYLTRKFVSLKRANIILYIFIVVAIVLLISYFSSLIFHLDSSSRAMEIEEFKSKGFVFFFFIAIIFAPIFETFIFQTVVLLFSTALFRRLKMYSLLYPVILSAILFGVSHCYNLPYMIVGTVIGFVFAFFYKICEKRKENAFFVIAATHAIYNFIPFSMQFIFV